VAKTVSATKLGEAGEEFVANHLIKSGARILARNWRTREGEIDIVAKDLDGTIIFVEVKSRTSLSYGDPLEAIDTKKALRIQRLALAWLATNGYLGDEYRIDGAGITQSRSGEFTLDYRRSIL
jgi:putative endonuclease